MFYVRGRRIWRARKPKSTPTKFRTDQLIIAVHHSASPQPKPTHKSEREWMRNTQNFHMDTRGWNDIGYNFIIMPSGRVYEGRGYHNIGAHVEGWNSRSIGVCFPGNYEYDKLTEKQVIAYRKLKNRIRAKGIKIRSEKPHSAFSMTACPGKNIRKTLGL